MLRADLNTQQAEISQYYFGYLREAATIFEDAIVRLNHCDHSQCDVVDAIDMAHRIKGNAAMYDYPKLGLKAADVEQLLRLEVDNSDHASSISSLINFVDEIHKICRENDELEPSELHVTLAVDSEDPEQATQSASVSYNRKSILIAFQDNWLCELMTSLLEPEYDVVCVNSDQEARQSIRAQRPNLVILEDVLGGSSALELLKEMSTSNLLDPKSVFIAFGPNSHEEIAQAIGLGVQGFTEDKHEILEIVSFAKNHLDKPAPTVLVVDDDPMVRELLKHSLTSGGLIVDMASDGIEALSYLSNKTPDLILLDRFMPRLEGGTVLYEVQNKINLKSIPVLILTAMVNRGEAKSWFERGAADFIPKPFDPEEVLMRVKQHLEAKQRVA